ncbi:hypothetical protein D3C74_140760 [compost metagenome]
MGVELYGTYVLNQETVMCTGIDKEADLAVFAPFYSEDAGDYPEIHAEDGVIVLSIWDIVDLQAISPYKLKPKFRLSAELIGFEDES